MISYNVHDRVTELLYYWCVIGILHVMGTTIGKRMSWSVVFLT